MKNLVPHIKYIFSFQLPIFWSESCVDNPSHDRKKGREKKRDGWRRGEPVSRTTYLQFYSTQVSFKAAWLTAPDTLVFRTQKDRPPEIFLSKPKLLKHFLLAILEYFLRYIYLLCFFSSIYLRVEQNFFILHKAYVSFFLHFNSQKSQRILFFLRFKNCFHFQPFYKTKSLATELSDDGWYISCKVCKQYGHLDRVADLRLEAVAARALDEVVLGIGNYLSCYRMSTSIVIFWAKVKKETDGLSDELGVRRWIT